jgi:hypothetical protein
MRIPTISHPMTELPPDVLSLICSSLFPWGAVHFSESTTTALSHPSLTARRLPSHLLRRGRSVSSASPSDAYERPRGHMQRQVQECENVNSIALVGPGTHGNANVVGIENILGQGRTSPLNGHQPLPILGRESSHWIRLGEEFSYLQCLVSL